MFWGLTIEPGKHYSQTVDQSFHVSMAALESREKTGTTQLLVRHEKAEFLLCTLQYGDDIPYPCLQQTLELNLSEGSEISFYSEGKGTIHLTGYLVTDEPLLEEDPELVAEANSLLVGSDEEEDFDSEEEDDDEEDDEEYTDSDMESTSSQDASCNWQQLINEFDGEDDDDSEEEEWTPESAKKSAKKAGQEKKRKSQDDSVSDDLSLSAYKKKRKAAVQAETLSKMEIATDEGGEEEEDGDFNPVEENDSDDDEEDEEEYEEDEEEVEEEKPKSSPKKKAQTPKGKAEKSSAASPQKVIKKTEDAESEAQEKTESPLKKKKKKKKQQVKQDEETKEGELPLKNLKTNNKENIVQQKDKPAKKVQTPAKPKKIKLQSGTTIEDLKVGEGKLAKPGKKVFMYYRGVLANNQKEFDSQLSGKPFMFGLGKGEVIQGWDAGIIGMKVGGKRRLTVPPSQGYGSQRTGPIPPNSTLIFDVELKSVR